MTHPTPIRAPLRSLDHPSAGNTPGGTTRRGHQDNDGAHWAKQWIEDEAKRAKQHAENTE